MGLNVYSQEYMEAMAARVDTGIDTKVEVICQSCGGRISTRLEAERDFLFPNLD